MAARAWLVFAMDRHLLAKRENTLCPGNTIFQWRHVRRRLGRRRAKDILEHPDSSFHRRRSEILNPGDGEKAALAQQSSPVIHCGPQHHAAESSAVDIRDSVMFGQAFIYEGVVCRQ